MVNCKFCKSQDTDFLFKRFEDKAKKIQTGRIYICFTCGRFSYFENKKYAETQRFKIKRVGKKTQTPTIARWGND